ncbi:MAG TPA: cysteine hydrolase [Candidatus Thermoplasmatota archaeon]|nr:cysteine hydrolase [Candidatus Thermoplasmatota archaeon]
MASRRTIRPRRIELDARPEPLDLEGERTAVLVIGMQNDFGAKGGMLDRAGIDIGPVQRAVAPTQRVLAAARRAGLPIVYLKMAFRADLSDLGPLGAPNRARHVAMNVGQQTRAPDGRESRIMVRDTWNSDILPELAPKAGDKVLYHHRPSGFFGTPLEDTLRELRADQLVVMGCTTSVCVESTVRDAIDRDQQCVLIEDCMGEPIGSKMHRTNHDASVLALQTMGTSVSDSRAFLWAVESALAPTIG